MFFNYIHKEYRKVPLMKLCYPNKKVIGYIDELFNLKIEPTFLDISPMSFEIKNDNKFSSVIRESFLIHVEGMGYFLIKSVNFNSDGFLDNYKIECESYETILSEIIVSYENTTYPLYSVLSPNTSLLGKIAEDTGWTIAHVDASICDKCRTFDNLENISVYTLLMNDMSDAYKCYFLFDIENKTISAYDREKVPTKTNIVFTFKNLMKNININGNKNSVKTVLHVSGADGVYISNVNPIGNSCLYDFSYVMTHDYGMSQELIEALIIWNEKVESAKTSYEELIEIRQDSNEQLVTAESELSALKAQYTSIQDRRSALKYTEIDVEERLATLYNEEVEVNNNISAKELEIATITNTYNSAVAGAKEISESLSLDNTDNFTVAQRLELKYYEYEASYNNENFVYTSIMTESEKIELSKELITEAQKTFNKLRQPCYEFSMDIINYLSLPEFKAFTDETQLGVLVNAEIKNGVWVQPRLLKVELDYENLDNTKFTFSDTLRLIDNIHTFEDTYNDMSKSSNKVAITASKWDEPNKSGFYDTVKNYMTESLDLARQEIMNSENQEVLFGSYGIICRRSIPETGTYEPQELRINNNVICFSKDGFQTVSTALGYLNFGGNTYYGLNCELLVGNMIVGNELTITTSTNTLTVNSEGTTLINADFTIENEHNKILLSPADGIKIQTKLIGDTWEDRFYTDTEGSITAKGITLEESNIAGWTTTDTAFASPTGDYIGSDGYGKISLLTYTPTSATFNGNIYANNLQHIDSGVATNVFVNGTMGGGWLTDASVGYGKLTNLCVNTLRANLVETEQLDAATARIGTLEANTVTADMLATNYLITNDGIFRGRVLVGSGTDTSEIWSSTKVIDARYTARCLYLSSTGGIEVYGNYGGITLNAGEKDVDTEDGTVLQKNPIVCNSPLTVGYEAIMLSDMKINGNLTLEGEISSDLSVQGRQDFHGDTQFYGGIYTDSWGTVYQGITQDVDCDKLHLSIKNGLVVSVTVDS